VRAALKTLRGVLDAAAAALLVAMLAVTTARVLARYALDLSMPWSEELTRLLFVWLVLVAASRTRHMSIDLLTNALPRRKRRALDVAGAILGAVLLAILVRYALGLVELTANDRFTALGVSVQYLYWAVVVGGGLWIVTSLADALLGHQEEPPTVA
jgi:TRAP-type C4-dicarboxylate transport system permease small subunit